MLSNNGTWRGNSLHSCNSTSGAYSYCRASSCCSCKSFNHGSSATPFFTCKRTGKVLIKSPTTFSTPGSSAGRPETVPPKSTSSRPLCRLSNNPHAPCKSVFIVNCCSWANVSRSRVNVDGSSRSSDWQSRLAADEVSPPIGVGDVKPASVCRQKPSASLRSCSRNHAM